VGRLTGLVGSQRVARLRLTLKELRGGKEKEDSSGIRKHAKREVSGGWFDLVTFSN